MKHVWTLEETILSSKMIFVGCRHHYWWCRLAATFQPFDRGSSECNVTRDLHWAHTRPSTKPHDHVFALVNIFPDIMNKLLIDYTQDIQNLMINFYWLLSEKDLSILCFRSRTSCAYKTMCKTSSSNNMINDGTMEPEYEVPIQKLDLPFRTDVDGEHLHDSIFGRALQLTFSGMTNNQHHKKNFNVPIYYTRGYTIFASKETGRRFCMETCYSRTTTGFHEGQAHRPWRTIQDKWEAGWWLLWAYKYRA